MGSWSALLVQLAQKCVVGSQFRVVAFDVGLLFTDSNSSSRRHRMAKITVVSRATGSP